MALVTTGVGAGVVIPLHVTIVMMTDTQLTLSSGHAAV